MTPSEKLLEKEIESEQYLESYKSTFSLATQKLYKKFTTDTRKIFQSYFGTKITLKVQSQINKDLKEKVETFKSNLKQFVETESEKAVEVFLEGEKKKVEAVVDKEIVLPTVALSSLLSLQIPLEEGRVVSINGMTDGIVSGIERDLRTISSRLRIIREDAETVNGYYNNAVRKNQNNLDVVTATILALIAGRIKYLFASQNKNAFSGYAWVSVIDGKTSDYCIYRHTKYWDFDDPSKSTLPAEEYPPGHFRCRSGISYIVRGDDAPDMPTYEEWFERQPESVKRNVLGQGRYDLYRNGQIEIKDFIDVESGRRLTLNELRALTNS